jgi:hypothetical protein
MVRPPPMFRSKAASGGPRGRTREVLTVYRSPWCAKRVAPSTSVRPAVFSRSAAI